VLNSPETMINAITPIPIVRDGIGGTRTPPMSMTF
jgi:hypothetical protein